MIRRFLRWLFRRPAPLPPIPNAHLLGLHMVETKPRSAMR